MIDAGKEGSFKYLFKPGELAGGRSFGLVVNVNYEDMVSLTGDDYPIISSILASFECILSL